MAKECGYLEGLPEFRSPDNFGYLPRDKVVAILTGSQGEPRAALARIAQDEHPDIALSAGDRVIFSSRAIPGNEKAVGSIINSLIEQGIEVITDRNELVHVSGHPRRGELAQMYQWTRPRIAIPAHGEAAASERACQVRAGPGRAGGGARRATEPLCASRRDRPRSSTRFRPGASTGTATSSSAQVSGRCRSGASWLLPASSPLPSPSTTGANSSAIRSSMPWVCPTRTVRAARLTDIIADTVADLLDGLSKAKRRDPEAVENAVHRAVRAAVNQEWGKKPACHVLVIEV